jgi:predicted nucleic acid-binding protein
MNKYLLDTNTISYLAEQDSVFYNAVKSNLSKLADQDQAYVSLFSLYEVEYGIAISEDEKACYFLMEVKNLIHSYFPILPFTVKSTEIFGTLKAVYKKETGIRKEAIKYHNLDFIIASNAIESEAILISNDNLFRRLQKIYPEFALEDWTKE